MSIQNIKNAFRYDWILFIAVQERKFSHTNVQQSVCTIKFLKEHAEIVEL